VPALAAGGAPAMHREEQQACWRRMLFFCKCSFQCKVSTNTVACKHAHLSHGQETHLVAGIALLLVVFERVATLC